MRPLQRLVNIEPWPDQTGACWTYSGLSDTSSSGMFGGSQRWMVLQTGGLEYPGGSEKGPCTANGASHRNSGCLDGAARAKAIALSATTLVEKSDGWVPC